VAKAPTRRRRRRPGRTDPDTTAETAAVPGSEPETTAEVPAVEAPLAMVEEPPRAGPPPFRIALISTMAVLAAAIMTGGVFLGTSPRIYAAVAGILGVALGVRVSEMRRPATMYAAIILGLVAIAVIITLPAGVSHVTNVTRDMREAAKLGNVLRPPVDFLPGWRPILGLLMGTVGFASVWAGLEMRRPALSLLIPIPIVAIAAISVPEDQQIAAGLVCLALFGAGLGILSGTETEGGKVSVAYEIRRAIRAVPLIGVITIAMYLLAQTNFLFPKPLYDPAQEAQRPKAVPLSDVEDRVLFRVEAPITGPWRTGTLDVYDGKYWRLPPFARTRFTDVSRSGVVDDELQPGVRANIEIAGLSGAVLPGLANLVGVIAEGPKLVYDQRTQNIRLKQGQVKTGLEYTLIASQLPSVQKLRLAPTDVPSDVKPFLEIPAPPPSMQAFLDQASARAKNPWDRLDYLRTLLLRTVAASGSGTPVAVEPERVVSMFTSKPEATPFEIVAAEAMIARWVGVPSRIGYGFDGGDKKKGRLEVHPRHGATWLEVYFPSFKWLPVIGKPLQAKTTLNRSQQQQTNLKASNDIAVQLYFPTVIEPPSQLLERVRNAIGIALPIIAGLLLLYYAWPAARKAFLRNRRRTWALRRGPAARVAVAYADWRDFATDYGFNYPSDTPLMYLKRVVSDEEHTELAWLVTRALWGDLRHDVAVEDAEAAEELSRSLRRRLSQTQTWVMRIIAAVSRLSVRNPYGSELGIGAPPPPISDREVAEVVA
jgi:transglutaminase TgpA-like protein/transglutaminase superfamily protein